MEFTKRKEYLDVDLRLEKPDCYRYLFPDGREYTWARKDMFRSRLDRFYIPTDLVTSLQDLSHHPFMSDHSYVKLMIKLPDVFTRVKAKKQ